MIALAERLDFTLAPELEAHEPPEARGLARDQVRMLVSRSASGDHVDARFSSLPGFLSAGDVLVVNTSATLPAALTASTAAGDRGAVHVSTALPAGLTVVEPRQLRVHEGDELTLPAGGSAKLLLPYRGSQRLWVAALNLPAELHAYLNAWGKPIRYPYVRGEWPIETYQTVFALQPGSAEMPSAGRPFSAAVLKELVAKGIVLARLTLHCGVASLEHDEGPYEEFFSVPPETAAAVNVARAAGQRIVAVGTSVARALESALDERDRVVSARGWTDHVISPGQPVRSFRSLLTGFHEPRSTHLALLRGLRGEDEIASAYRAALARGYLWHEFGDVHLIL
jgi:S-adenosylmethionine:tRNA ribosyltransferase-isomerase